MAATMKDIARRTGLGLATISSYFNGGNVREKNRIKIEEAIEELHYEVNEVARGLKTNATKTVGVVIPELNNVFCAEIISGMEDILRSHGYAAIVCDCRTDKKLEKEAVDFLTRKRVDGIINMPVDMTGAHLNEFQKTGKPIVLIDRMIQGISCDCVLVDNVNAAEKAVGMLVEEQHQKIGLIGGPDEVFTARQRMLGYMKALKAHGIAVDEKLICHGDYTIQGGVQAVEELVKENPDMTAVFVTNYEMTMRWGYPCQRRFPWWDLTICLLPVHADLHLPLFHSPQRKLQGKQHRSCWNGLKEEMSFLNILYGNFRLIFLWGNP